MSRWSLGLYGDIGNNFKPFLNFNQSFKTQESFEEFYKGKLTESMCSIAKNNTLYVVTPVPEMMVNVPQYMSRQLSIFGKEVDSVFISRAEYDKRHKIAMSALKKAEKDCGVHLIDVTDIFCNEEKCYSTSNGYPLFHDFDHLSQTGNKVLVNHFLNIL